MKCYHGMYKTYFDIKNKQDAAKIAAALHDSVSAIAPGFSIAGSPAFIVYCDEIIRELTDIRNMNLRIDRLSWSLPTIANRQFLKQAIVEEIHQTNEMENIHSTRKEIKDEMLVIENGQKGKRFDGMIRKYQLLLQQEQIPLNSCQDVRALYDSFVLDEVMKENPEDAPDGIYFRKSPVSVMKQDRVIHEGVFPEATLNEAMEQALHFLNDNNYDPLIRIAAFHYMFGYIHPFYNGNGRMTRFISSCTLSTENIHLLVALRLSYVIKSHRARYYEMFKTTNDKRNFGDMTCFVIGFLKFIKEASEQVLAFLQDKAALLDHYCHQINKLSLEDQTTRLLFILVQVSVCEGDSLSLTELANACEVSKYIVKKCIATVEPFCISTPQGRALTYRADLEKIDAIDNP